MLLKAHKKDNMKGKTAANKLLIKQAGAPHLFARRDLSCFLTISPGVSFSLSVGGVNTYEKIIYSLN